MSEFPKTKTLLLDIDGTLFKHGGDMTRQCTENPVLLPGVKEKFIEWDRKGYRIILISGRRESERENTVIQLKNAGLFYDQLILGAGNGPRVLVNDLKDYSPEPTAVAVNIVRNSGLEKIDI